MATARITFRLHELGFLQPMADGKDIPIESCTISMDRDGVKAAVWIDLGWTGVVIDEPAASTEAA